MDRSLMKENSEKKSLLVLLAWADACDVADLQCQVNPSEKDFSCYSARHRCFRGIDFLFAFKTLFFQR